MKRLLLFAFCLSPSVALGGNRQQLVDVPVAVAVGVPVAELAPIGYSYVPQPPVVVNIDTAQLAKQIVAEVGRLENPPAGLEQAHPAASTPGAALPAPPPAQPLVADACAHCHNGGNQSATARIKFSSFADLTDKQKLACIRAVTSGQMPKGEPLTPEQRGQVLLNLTQ